MRISKSCIKLNLYLPQELRYQTESCTAIRLGFGNLSTEELVELVNILKLAVQEFKEK